MDHPLVRDPLVEELRAEIGPIEMRRETALCAQFSGIIRRGKRAARWCARKVWEGDDFGP